MYLNVLKESCDINGFKFIHLGYKEKWGGFIWKFYKFNCFLNSSNTKYSVWSFVIGKNTSSLIP